MSINFVQDVDANMQYKLVASSLQRMPSFLGTRLSLNLHADHNCSRGTRVNIAISFKNFPRLTKIEASMLGGFTDVGCLNSLGTEQLKTWHLVGINFSPIWPWLIVSSSDGRNF